MTQLLLSFFLALALFSTTTAFRSCFDFDAWQCRNLVRIGHCTSPVYSEFTRQVCCVSCNAGTTRAPKPKASDSCTDTKWQCPSWAKQGYCTSKKHTWLKEGCCLSCSKRIPLKKPQRKTNFKQVAARITTGKPIRPAKSCRDSDENCSFWAENGYCPLYQITCCRSCSRKSVKCSDKHKSCDHWSKEGYCSSNRFAISNCCESCSKILIDTKKKKRKA